MQILLKKGERGSGKMFSRIMQTDPYVWISQDVDIRRSYNVYDTSVNAVTIHNKNISEYA